MHRRAVTHQLCCFPDAQRQIHPQAQGEGMAQAIGGQLGADLPSRSLLALEPP